MDEESWSLIFPLGHPFKCTSSVFVNARTNETLYDEINFFAEQTAETSGNILIYMETSNAPHSLILSGLLVGFKKETADAIEQAVDFCES
jgi:hypothetical protein